AIRPETEAGCRGALRQGAGQPIPPRHAPDPLPAGQGSGAVHLAGGPPAAPPGGPHGVGASRPRASKRETRLTFRFHIPAVRSPTLSIRLRMVFSVNFDGSQRGTSSHVRGAEARASGVG